MDYLSWQKAFVDTGTQLVERATAFVPNLLGAAVLLLFGWLVARISRASIARLIGVALDRAARSRTVGRALEKTRLRETAPWLASAIAYWIILLFFLAAAVERLELAIASNLVGQLAQYLPNVLLGLALVFVGIVAGKIAHNAVAKAATSAGVAQGPILARTIEIVVVFLGVILGADQIGIESTLLTLVVTILVSTILGGAALAFGFGARQAVSNLISSHYLTRMYQLGQRVRISGVEGRILEFNHTGVVLEASEGRVFVPASKFSKESSVLREGEQ